VKVNENICMHAHTRVHLMINKLKIKRFKNCWQIVGTWKNYCCRYL